LFSDRAKLVSVREGKQNIPSRNEKGFCLTHPDWDHRR